MVFFFFFKQKTAYEMRISDWSSDVCSSDLKGANYPLTPRYRRCKRQSHKDMKIVARAPIPPPPISVTPDLDPGSIGRRAPFELQANIPLPSRLRKGVGRTAAVVDGVP